MRAVGVDVDPEAGARIARHFDVQISGDTLLRVLRQTLVLDKPEPRAIGTDDWAFETRWRYSTILVGLECRCAIDYCISGSVPNRCAAI